MANRITGEGKRTADPEIWPRLGERETSVKQLELAD
jgi:hypothetical protein